MMNHYQTLGVAPNASGEEIKAAHRKLVRLHHPDIGGDPALFKAIQEASEVIGDADKRREYDQALRNQPVDSLPEVARQVVSEYFQQC